jgi:hypothetical protein
MLIVETLVLPATNHSWIIIVHIQKAATMNVTPLHDDIWGVIVEQLESRDNLNFGLSCKYFNLMAQTSARWLKLCNALGLVPLPDEIPYKCLQRTFLRTEVNWKAYDTISEHRFPLHTSYAMGVQFDQDKLISVGGINDNEVVKCEWVGTDLKRKCTILKHKAAGLQVRYLDNIGASVGYDSCIRVFDVERECEIASHEWRCATWTSLFRCSDLTTVLAWIISNEWL